MKNYQLIEVVGRDIELSYHDTLEDAQKDMKKRFMGCLCPDTISYEQLSLLEPQISQKEEGEDIDGNFWWGKDGAYIHDGASIPCDWLIVNLSEER